MIATVNINKERLWGTLIELSKYGKDPEGGITRLSLSEEEMQARSYITQLMKDAGLAVKTDQTGNIIGRLEGKTPNASTVIAGSHIDTVVQGGMFDGALGVLGAIEAVRSIKEQGIIHSRPIEVISFTDEEGARFGTGFVGSKGYTGKLTESDLEVEDDYGITYREAFEQAGLNPEEAAGSNGNVKPVKAYLEMHIEQGRVLETENIPVGIVDAIQGPIWCEIHLVSKPDHAGATPMDIRHDPTLVMAETIQMIEKTAIYYEGVMTVGKMSVKPGGINIIPGYVTFPIDMRHSDKKIREKMKDDTLASVKQFAASRGVKMSATVLAEQDPKACSPNIISTLENACVKSGLKKRVMNCGAGHDALLMADITDMGMILVRSKEGVSHSPDEWSDKEDCAAGTQVLCEALIELAYT